MNNMSSSWVYNQGCGPEFFFGWIRIQILKNGTRSGLNFQIQNLLFLRFKSRSRFLDYQIQTRFFCSKIELTRSESATLGTISPSIVCSSSMTVLQLQIAISLNCRAQCCGSVSFYTYSGPWIRFVEKWIWI